MIDKFENEKHDTPYFRLYDQANDLLVENSWPNSDLLSELKNLNLEDVKKFRDSFFKSIEVVGLSHGNVTEEDAIGIADLLRETFIDQHELTTVEKSRVVDLALGSKTMASLNLEHEDSAVVLFKQAQGESFEDKSIDLYAISAARGAVFSSITNCRAIGLYSLCITLPECEYSLYCIGD